MGDIKTASLKEIREMKQRGEIEKPGPDADVLRDDLPEDFWKNAVLKKPC